MKKESIVRASLFVSLFVLCFSFANATNVTFVPFNSTFAYVNITDAAGLYAFEINVEYGSNSPSIVGANFFSSDFGTGTNTPVFQTVSATGNNVSTYSSIMNSSTSGFTGSRVAFNVSNYSSDMKITSALFVYSDGTEEFVNYTQHSVELVPIVVNNPSGGGGSASPGSGAVERPDVALSFGSDSGNGKGININAVMGQSTKRQITIRNDGSTSLSINVRIEGVEGFISTDSVIALGPREEKKINLDINSIDKGLLTGKIILEVGGAIVKEIPLVINSKSENFLFDASIDLPLSLQNIIVGDELRAQINLQQLGPNEKVDVTANYVIKDFDGNEYYRSSETFAVTGSKGFVKKFPTDDLPVGSYILGMEIVYPGAFATSSTQFEVLEKRPWGIFSLNNVLLLLIIWGIISVSVVFWSILRKR